VEKDVYGRNQNAGEDKERLKLIGFQDGNLSADEGVENENQSGSHNAVTIAQAKKAVHDFSCTDDLCRHDANPRQWNNNGRERFGFGTVKIADQLR